MEQGPKPPIGAEEPSSSSSSSSPRSQKIERQNLHSIDEGATYLDSRRSTNLTLQIPPRPTNVSSNLGGENLIQPQSSPGGTSSTVHFTRGTSLKNKAVVLDGETSSLLNPEHNGKLDIRACPENAALTNFVAALSWKRCASLPVTRASNISPSSPLKEKIYPSPKTSQKRAAPVMVSRSLSVPMRNIVVVRSGSFHSPTKLAPASPLDGHSSPINVEDNDEEIPEEEAVCRICFIGLNEGGNWLRMECSCKGALRLTHEACALKWFRIKGNKQCDVCGREVLNLPVTLFRLQSTTQRDTEQRPIQTSNIQLNGSWQDVVVLILISTMCYFFFLEQLLVNDMKSNAIVIAAPFSLTLGLLGSVFAIILSCREYVWAYSAFQFSLVVIFLHFFYSMIQLKPVFAILFASFAGFGIAMGINSFCLQCIQWRSRAIQLQAQISSDPV